MLVYAISFHGNVQTSIDQGDSEAGSPQKVDRDHQFDLSSKDTRTHFDLGQDKCKVCPLLVQNLCYSFASVMSGSSRPVVLVRPRARPQHQTATDTDKTGRGDKARRNSTGHVKEALRPGDEKEKLIKEQFAVTSFIATAGRSTQWYSAGCRVLLRETG